ncbi:MAG: pentapeptide repeat-containing protein [Spirulina sp.]
MFIYLSIYNWRYFVGIHNVAIAFAAIGGTNFHRANLSNADFSKATLKSTDLRGAILIRTCWRDTEKLDRIQLGISILRQPQIRELLKTGNGYGKFFLKANLWSANLQRANLENANLKQSNLSNATLCDTNLTNANLSEAQLWNTDFSNASLVEANLRDANLSEANLSNANLAITTALNTNFESVTLTGACIHDWNINSNTKFDNVICEYIFLGIGFTDRRPSDLNTIFEPGDFARLFQKLHETADLIFRDGINWQAFSTSFQALKAEQVKVEGDDRAFSVRAIENLDDGSFVVRINTPKGADKAEIERLFQEKYEGELKRLEGVYRERLQAKDEQIEQYKRENTNLWELAKLGAARPINVENKAVADQSKSDRSIHIKANEFKGAANVEKIEGGAVYNEGYNIYNANAPEKQTLAETAKEIQDLLKQLEESNPTTTKTEEMLVAAEAIKEIESKPTLKQKAINAAKGGALEVLKQNPIGAFVAGAIEGWTNEG